MKRILAALALLPAFAFADPKMLGRWNTICLEPGTAMTFTVQCDPGTRTALDNFLSPGAPGTAVCTALFVGCFPIEGRQAVSARAGFEVQDTSPYELVLINFGLDRLLGMDVPVVQDPGSPARAATSK